MTDNQLDQWMENQLIQWEIYQERLNDQAEKEMEEREDNE